MATLGIVTSLGFCVPNEHGAWTLSPGFPARYGDPDHEYGTITVGSDSYSARTSRGQYDTRIEVYKNGTYFGGTACKPAEYIGFYVTGGSDQQGDYVIAHVACVDNPSRIDGLNSLPNQTGYGSGDGWCAWSIGRFSDSVLVEDRDWDESPSTNEDDPDNELPRGGAFAELGDFSDTHMQFLDDLPEPETIDYGSLITAYQLWPGDLSTLGDAIFLPNFWQSLMNKFSGLSDPMSFIISAVEIPFRLGTGSKNFKIGGVEAQDSNGSPISIRTHTARYLKYDFGTITMKEVWGTARDYTDCSISIYLPYVGMRTIDTDLAVNSRLNLQAIIDVWTGDLNYMLEINNSVMRNKYFASSGIAYRWSGNCGNRVPMGKVDPSTPILNVASALGSMAIGAGMIAMAPEAAPAAAAAGATAGAAGGSMIASGAKELMHEFNKGFSPIAESSGNLSGAVGYLDYQYPYLVIKRSVPIYPNNWKQELGAPRYQEFLVDDLSGYTEFAEIHADDIDGASDDEKKMIEEILMSGVIL